MNQTRKRAAAVKITKTKKEPRFFIKTSPAYKHYHEQAAAFDRCRSLSDYARRAMDHYANFLRTRPETETEKRWVAKEPPVMRDGRAMRSMRRAA